MKRVIFPILALSLALNGCGKKGNVIASVDGKDVTQAEFDAYLKNKHVAAADAVRRDRAFQEYLDRSALAAVIDKEKLLDRQDIDAEVDEFRRELLISRYFDRFLDDKVNDGAVKNYYDAHAASYEQRKAHVAHILVRLSSKAGVEEKKAKHTTADGIASKLAAGESFEELAKTMSDDHISGAKGGDLGWIREGSIDPELSKRAFSMKAGSVSEPFETPFGFHVMKVIEEPKVIRKPYAAVMGDIRYQLRNEAKEAELKRLKDKVRISKKNAYKFDPSAAPSATPRKAIVPTLPSADSEPAGPGPTTMTGASSPLPPTGIPPAAATKAPEPKVEEKAAKADKKEVGKKPSAAKPAAAKPAPAPVAPAAPAAPPAEAPPTDTPAP